jgi:hypothetical protein
VQLSLSIIVASIVAGAILLSFLLHRLGFSRAVVLGLAVAILGATTLVSREPLVDSSAESFALSPTETTADTAGSAGQAMRSEIARLRARIAALEAAADGASTATEATAALDRERAAHRQTREALKAASTRLAALEVGPSLSATAPARSDAAAGTPTDDLATTRLKLALAEAEIIRLQAALRAAEPVATASPLPAAPAPFSNAPDRVPASIPTAAAGIVTGAPQRDPQPEQAPHQARDAAALDRILAEAIRTGDFTLARLDDDEVVAGRHGRYLRITCPDKDGRPLGFSSGDYTLAGGDGALATCFAAVREALLEALPASGRPRLYVQGYASRRAFLKPKPFPPRDARLQSVAYLPRHEGQRFAATPAMQKVADRYTNTELPNLRAAYVADWIGKATHGAVRPEILQGEHRADADPLSQGFTLLLAVE